MSIEAGEYTKLEISKSLRDGWKAVSKQETPPFVESEFKKTAVKFDNLLGSKSLAELKTLAFEEGIRIAYSAFRCS